jgi:hypothetical protein
MNMQRILAVLLLAGLLVAADAPYVPHGADGPLAIGASITILPCVVFDKGGFDGSSHYLSQSQTVTVEGFDGRFYRVKLADGKTGFIYRTELGIKDGDGPAPVRNDREMPVSTKGSPSYPVAGDTLTLLSPVWYKDSDLLSESHLMSGSQRVVVRQPENPLGFLEIDSDSLGRGWIYRVELDHDERRPPSGVKVSR